MRPVEMIAAIYTKLDLSALTARATLLLCDGRLDRDHPLRGGERQMFSRKATRLVRASNVIAQIMQVPAPTAHDEFSWVTVTGNDATPFSGLVYSMDVDRDLHYVADGLVTHNCWYAVRGSGSSNWHGDRKQTTLWTVNAREDDGHGHGTQKPVECMRRPIENNSWPGQAVYEPFNGSGSTLIAAEMSGRSCLAIDIDPAYVDVAALRWQAFTGEAALLEQSGKSFADVGAERAQKGKR